MAEVIWTQAIQVGDLAPGFGLFQSSSLWLFREYTNKLKITPIFLSLRLSVTLTFKEIRKNMSLDMCMILKDT